MADEDRDRTNELTTVMAGLTGAIYKLIRAVNDLTDEMKAARNQPQNPS